MATEDEIPIGSLRWRVRINKRVQAPDTGTGIAETLQKVADVHADVQPVGALTFYGAQQTETPITHFIVMRWQPYLDNTNIITRLTQLPGGASRTETFRIRRIREMAGRKRFVRIEAELEAAR